MQAGAKEESHSETDTSPPLLSERVPPRGFPVLVGAVGIEPTTFGLKGHCSTTELRP
jgi:hypothetical protein